MQNLHGKKSVFYFLSLRTVSKSQDCIVSFGAFVYYVWIQAINLDSLHVNNFQNRDECFETWDKDAEYIYDRLEKGQ